MCLLTYLFCQRLPHSDASDTLWCPDLACCDFWLFLKVKSQLKSWLSNWNWIGQYLKAKDYWILNWYSSHGWSKLVQIVLNIVSKDSRNSKFTSFELAIYPGWKKRDFGQWKRFKDEEESNKKANGDLERGLCRLFLWGPRNTSKGD